MKNSQLEVYGHVLKEMVQHALRERPNECCGLLLGKKGIIEESQPCTNERESPVEFSIPAEELFEFFRRLRQENKELMGIYHSHPNGKPVPSDRDIKDFHYQGTSYWIVSLQNEKASVRCFEWKQSGFLEVPFSVLEKTS
jgi:proteasome lid subunit RPN8/RPN11